MDRPFAVSHRSHAAVWLDGPWTDAQVIEVAHYLSPWRISVCNQAACPWVWMWMGDVFWVRTGPSAMLAPGVNGKTVQGCLNGSARRDVPTQIAWLSSPVPINVPHEFWHALGGNHRHEPGYFTSGDGYAMGYRWHPDDINENPNSPQMVNLKQFCRPTRIKAGRRWQDRPAEVGWRVVDYRPDLGVG